LLIPETQYVKTPDGAHVAYQVFGSGPFDLVCVPGFASNVEHMWRLAPFASAYRRLASFARVIVFDRRGTGLSDRIDGANLPTLEARMDDIRAVMDAAEVERAALFGHEDGALLCAVFAATHPSRSFAAVLHGTGPRGSWAPDYPCGWTAEQWDEYLTRVDDSWGTEAFTQYMIEEAWSSHVGDVEFRREFASFLRVSASPGAAVVFESLYRETDIRDVLGTIQMPVLVMHSVGSRVESIECARYLAAHIPGARLVELPGDEHFPFAGNQAQTLLETIERFLTSVYGDDEEIDRVLATVLFTDVVRSTETAVAMGDRSWRDLVAGHDQRVRALLGRFRGREIDSAGDGFLAIFDGPARAVRCGLAIEEALRPLGLEVRVGVHTGEVELDGPAIRGVAVHTGARIMAQARPGEVLVSSTVRDLVAGSGLGFEARGQHELKGIPGSWQLHAAIPPSVEPLV
jgi:class 3 adenylate cyclase/pimeloyl-ACP methyl ester carboxylesterase